MVSIGQWRAFPHRSNLIVVAALLVGAILLRLIFFQGYVDSDPAYYARLAAELAKGNLHFGYYDGAVAFPLRLGVYAPVAFFIKMFGLSENNLIVFPFLVSIAGCLLAYFLARNLFGPTAGLISLALVAFLPADIAMASTLYPDSIAAFWANLGIGLLILDPRKDLTLPSLSFSFFAGLCFGLSWLSKESVVYLGPFVLFYLYQRQSAIPHLACVGVAAFTILSSESVLYRVVTGDWLYHFHTIRENYLQNAVWFFDQSSPYFGWNSGEYGQALLRRLLMSGPQDLLRAFCKFPTLAIVALAWGAFTRDRRFIIPGVWLVILMLMFNFGSSSLTAYKPLPLYFQRYLYPMILPAVLLISGLFASLVEIRGDITPDLMMERRFWAAAFAASVAAMIIIAIKEVRPRPEQAIHRFALGLQPSDVVYTDFQTARTLTFFRTGKLAPSAPSVIPFEHLHSTDMPVGSYVLLSQTRIDFVVGPKGTSRYDAPEFAKTPPASWRSVRSERGLTMFHVE